MRNQFKLGRHEVAHSLAAGLLGDEIETPEIVRIAAISAGHLGFVDEALGNWKQPVSYTHLDVYKRQCSFLAVLLSQDKKTTLHIC